MRKVRASGHSPEKFFVACHRPVRGPAYPYEKSKMGREMWVLLELPRPIRAGVLCCEVTEAVSPTPREGRASEARARGL